MITQVDRNGDVVVQKVTTPDGTVLRYQCGIPGDAEKMIPYSSLTEARIAIGKNAAVPA